MTKKLMTITLILAGLTLAGCGGAKTEKLIESGNESFARQDYATALTAYEQAAAKNPDLAEPIYNAANVQYRQDEFEQTNATLQVALANAGEGLAADGYFNLGNTHFQTEQYAEAVEAYTKSLRLNPYDMDAKVNLELALLKLRQEQEQQSQDEQSQDEQSQDEQSQDEQSQDEQSQDEQSQDEQSQDEQSQDEQSQDKENQGEQGQDEQDHEQQEQSQETQDQQGQGEQEREEQEQDQQSQNEKSQGQQSQDQQEQQNETDPQNGEETSEQPEQPDQQQPQPGQVGDEPTDKSQDPTEMALGELLEMEGLSEEQARQLLVAAAQGTETLQEYLQQMIVFPYSDVEQDW